MLAFLRLRKSLLLFIISLLIIQICCHAMIPEDYDRENCLSLKKISKIFCCLCGSYLESSSKYPYKKLSASEKNIEIWDQGIQPITKVFSINELLYNIVSFLPPPNIINLIKSDKLFSCLKINDFWLYYNRENNYIMWNERIPAVKVAFSYYWFKNHQVRKAASIGLPKAISLFKQQEKKRENSQLRRTWNYSIERSYIPGIPGRYRYKLR